MYILEVEIIFFFFLLIWLDRTRILIWNYKRPGLYMSWDITGSCRLMLRRNFLFLFYFIFYFLFLYVGIFIYLHNYICGLVFHDNRECYVLHSVYIYTYVCRYIDNNRIRSEICRIISSCFSHAHTFSLLISYCSVIKLIWLCGIVLIIRLSFILLCR